MAALDINDLSYRLQEELRDVVRIFQEKGPKHFQMPLGIAFGALVASYFLIYRTTAQKLGDLQSQIVEQKTREKAAETYDGLRTQLLGFYSKMPRPEKKEGWLFDKVLQLASSQGLVLDNIGSQSEVFGKDYSLVSISITSRMSYAQLGKFLETIENQKPVLIVTGVSFEKTKTKTPAANAVAGVNEVKLEISTVFPKSVRTL